MSKIGNLIEQINKKWKKRFMLNSKEFNEQFDKLIRNYGDFEKLFVSKIAKECQNPENKKPLSNPNWNVEKTSLHKSCLISLYNKLKHLVIEDIKPLVFNWK